MLEPVTIKVQRTTRVFSAPALDEALEPLGLTDCILCGARSFAAEAIVLPSKTIAKSFDAVVVLDLDGITHTGVLKQEDERSLSLMTAEGKLVTIDKQNIEARKPGKSAMPEDLTKQLSKFELRDLVEFLASLQ